KRLEGVERPAITVCWPTIKDGKVAILDVGGNVDCKPIHLAHFAIMGDVYAKYVLGKDNPKIGLLSNGEEEGKGNELTRLTHELLKKSSLNYIGYVEGKDVFKGDIDVVVADGFVGNVALKFGEGLVEAMVAMLKKNMQESLLAKVGYLLARGAFAKFKKKLDYAEYGGAPLLGIDGICIISHGSSSAKAIKNAIFRANEFIKCGVTAHMNEELAKNKDLAIVSERQTG
ncbi:MAG: phosphate acyltransferase PlsX, partial [Thermodesulfobacteriota bacterium]